MGARPTNWNSLYKNFTRSTNNISDFGWILFVNWMNVIAAIDLLIAKQNSQVEKLEFMLLSCAAVEWLIANQNAQVEKLCIFLLSFMHYVIIARIR